MGKPEENTDHSLAECTPGNQNSIFICWTYLTLAYCGRPFVINCKSTTLPDTPPMSTVRPAPPAFRRMYAIPAWVNPLPSFASTTLVNFPTCEYPMSWSTCQRLQIKDHYEFQGSQSRTQNRHHKAAYRLNSMATSKSNISWIQEPYLGSINIDTSFWIGWAIHEHSPQLLLHSIISDKPGYSLLSYVTTCKNHHSPWVPQNLRLSEEDECKPLQQHSWMSLSQACSPSNYQSNCLLYCELLVWNICILLQFFWRTLGDLQEATLLSIYATVSLYSSSHVK